MHRFIKLIGLVMIVMVTLGGGCSGYGEEAVGGAYPTVNIVQPNEGDTIHGNTFTVGVKCLEVDVRQEGYIYDYITRLTVTFADQTYEVSVPNPDNDEGHITYVSVNTSEVSNGRYALTASVIDYFYVRDANRIFISVDHRDDGEEEDCDYCCQTGNC